MGQVLGKLDLNPPNVKSRCIFAKLYKVKKHLEQRSFFLEKKKKKREIIQL